MPAFARLALLKTVARDSMKRCFLDEIFFVFPSSRSKFSVVPQSEHRRQRRVTHDKRHRILFLTSREAVSIPSTVRGARGPARLRSGPAEILIGPRLMNAGQHDVVTLAYFITDQTLVGRCCKLVTVSSAAFRDTSADASFCITFSGFPNVVFLRHTLLVLKRCSGPTIILSIQT